MSAFYFGMAGISLSLELHHWVSRPLRSRERLEQRWSESGGGCGMGTTHDDHRLGGDDEGKWGKHPTLRWKDSFWGRLAVAEQESLLEGNTHTGAEQAPWAFSVHMYISTSQHFAMTPQQVRDPGGPSDLFYVHYVRTFTNLWVWDGSDNYRLMVGGHGQPLYLYLVGTNRTSSELCWPEVFCTQDNLDRCAFFD